MACKCEPRTMVLVAGGAGAINIYPAGYLIQDEVSANEVDVSLASGCINIVEISAGVIEIHDYLDDSRGRPFFGGIEDVEGVASDSVAVSALRGRFDCYASGADPAWSGIDTMRGALDTTPEGRLEAEMQCLAGMFLRWTAAALGDTCVVTYTPFAEGKARYHRLIDASRWINDKTAGIDGASAAAGGTLFEHDEAFLHPREQRIAVDLVGNGLPDGRYSAVAMGTSHVLLDTPLGTAAGTLTIKANSVEGGGACPTYF